MSLDVVNKGIQVVDKKIQRGEPVKLQDVEPVLYSAEHSKKGRNDGVSNVEARAVADMFVRLSRFQGAPKDASAPEPKAAASAPVVEDAVFKGIGRFFAAHNCPYGENRTAMIARLNDALSARGNDLGAPLVRPSRIGSLQPLRLSGPGEPAKVAYVDVVKKNFTVKLEGQFYGPFDFTS